MKKLFIFLIGACSLSAFATNGETSALINDPSIDSVYFSGGSDENGVCIALGFEQAAVGATLYKTVQDTPMIEVNSAGNISGGDTGRNYRRISKIICINKVQPIRYDARIIGDPRTSGGVYFSGGSNENGVCLALGYEKAAVGATLYKTVQSFPMVEVNSRGEVSGGDTGSNYRRISNIVCINQLDRYPLAGQILVNPSHPLSGQPFSGGSDENGVCIALGYTQAAVGATLYQTVRNTPMIEVNSRGNVSGGDTGSKYRKILKIVCI